MRILQALASVADALRTLLGSACSCEIAKLEEGCLRVIKSTNPEDVGLDIQISPEEAARLEDSVHLSETGKTVRTVAVPIKSGERLIGRMVVTVDLSVPLIDLLEQLGSTTKAPETVPTVKSSDDLVRNKIDEAVRRTATQRGVSYQSKNKMVVKELYDARIFEVRGAIDTVAAELGVSRYTIYNYLREVKA
ncbi:MAG: helix-turn-helix domain-containing protein [Spirochaetota bacterium]